MLLKEINLKGYKRLYLNEIKELTYTPKSKFQLIVGRNGSGKAQPLYSKIKVPNGWKTMGEIELGDEVSTPDGSTEIVIGIFPQPCKRNVYEITTETGRKAHCDRDHLWKANVKGHWAIYDTGGLLLYFGRNKKIIIPIYENGKLTYEKIISIKRQRRRENMQCIMLSGEENLYITDDYIVTHNTSLLNAIFNQPADKTDYDKGGINRIVVEHKRFEYELVNDFESGAKFYFRRRPIDSEESYTELNASRLVTTQRELVQEHFGLDNDIISLLLGEVEFTSMPINKRREWFSKMHVADLTYITNLYQTIKAKHRDVIGTIKTVGNKLTVEKNLQITKEEYETIVERREVLNNQNRELAKSFSQDVLDEYNPNAINQVIDKLKQSQSKVIGYFKNDNIDYKDLTKNIEESREYLTTLKIRKEETEKQLIQAKKRFDKMALDKKEYSQYSSTETLKESEKQIVSQLENINRSYERYNALRELKYDSPYLNVDNLQKATQNILLAIPSKDDDLSLKGYRYEDLINRQKQIDNDVEHCQFTLSKYIEKKKHLESHSTNVSCPKCKATFRYNESFVEDNLESVTNAINANSEKLTQLENIQKEHLELLERYKSYRSRFDALKPLIEDYGISELIPFILKNTTYSSRCDVIREYFNVYLLKVNERNLKSELKLIQEQLRIRQEKGEDYFERIEGNIDNVEKELRTYQETIYNLSNEINLIERNLKVKELLTTVVTGEIPNLLKDLDKACIDEYQYQKNKLLKEMWENSLNELQHINKKYNEYKMKENLINGYESIIEESIKKKDHYAILMDELSPQNGLIAEKATTFINHFIKNLNIVIRKIFNYDLIVEPCDLEEGDLTYRFRVTGGNQVRNDISNTSEGQKEVINLAFKLLAYHYCHLEEIPFVNDELGKNFDEYHKQASVNYLKDLMVEDRFNQFFLISHHATSYTSLIDAEVVVLDSNNVVLPEKYNTGLIVNNK